MNWLKRLFVWHRPPAEPANVTKHGRWIEARIERVERTIANEEIKLIKERHHDGH